MATLKPFLSNRFVVIGRAGMDFYAEPPGTRVESAGQFSAALGGSSANIAAGISRQGGATALVTCVSDDAVGDFTLGQLQKYGIDSRHVRRIKGEERTSLAVVATRSDDTQSVIYRNGAADFEMNRDDVERIDYASFGALITTGTVFASEPSRDAAFHAFQLASEAGLPIIFDIDYRPYSWPSAEIASEVYSRAGRLCHIVVGNDEEFDFMAGGAGKGLDFARSLATSGAGMVVYKMGPAGSISFVDSEEHKIGVYAVDALKPTGAGDAFMAGFVSGLAAKLDSRQAVLRGSASAAIVVTRVGCAPAMPTEAEVTEFMNNNTPPG